jgi:hypothetical protein
VLTDDNGVCINLTTNYPTKQLTNHGIWGQTPSEEAGISLASEQIPTFYGTETP